MTRPDYEQRADAWAGMFAARSATATHAITLSYNNRYGGTASWCYRITQDGECVRLPTSGVPAERAVNRLPTIRQVPLERVHADLRAWHYRMDRALYGSRFHRLPEHLRSAFIGMIEHAHTNIHVHLLWTMPEAQAGALADVVVPRWQKVTDGYGSAAVSRLNDCSGWASYCLKDHFGAALEGDPLLFVSSVPARSAVSHP